MVGMGDVVPQPENPGVAEHLVRCLGSVEGREKGEGGREREEALLALRAAHPHTVGYVGVCDQEEG